MSQQEISAILANITTRFDRNTDAQITWTEFQEALLAESLDIATADVIRSQVFANWDGNRDLVLSLEEIRKLAETWASFPGDQSA